VPLLCIGVASHFGVFAVDPQYAWLGSPAGLLALGIAALLEVGGYYIPLVDHALDVIATPLATVAGILAMFVSIGGDHGIPGWLLAVVLGGGVSGAMQLTTVKARAISTGTTAGFANSAVATSGLAIFVPALAVVLAVILLVVLWRASRWVRQRLSSTSHTAS